MNTSVAHIELAQAAREAVAGQIKEFTERDFWGETGVSLVWVAGAITEVRPVVAPKIRYAKQ